MRHKWIAAAIALFAVTFVAPALMAQETGQYAVVAIPPSANERFSQALIIDTKNGYVWKWISQGAIGNIAGAEGIFYQGQVMPKMNSNKSGTGPVQ